METTATPATSLTEDEAMATIDAMRAAEEIKAAFRRNWRANTEGARFSVLGAYRRQHGQRRTFVW